MNEKKILVVLVHGFCTNRFAMWPLAHLLRREGFKVRQWSYNSLFEPVAIHAKRLSHFLSAIQKNEGCFQIVAHSMGAMVARSALYQCEHQNLGRLVFLAPPNGG